MSKYYARNKHDKEFDDDIRNIVYEEGNRLDMAKYLQNQEELNLLRTIYQMLKGYAVSDGYMGWIDQEKRYRLFPTEQEYKEFIAEVE